MKNIQIKFKLNKELDKQMGFQFLDMKTGGVDFSEGMIFYHSCLKEIREIKNKQKRWDQLSEYVDNFYLDNGKKMQKCLKIIKEDWSRVEKDFFMEVDKIFKGYKWPKGEYICYLSIFNNNPRFLENKTWQIFYQTPEEYKRIVAHEMLHFIFLDYFEKNNTEQRLKDNWWMISEVFNTVILNTLGFKKIIKPGKELGYPDHKEIIERMAKEWKILKNLEKWLTKF